MLEVVLTYPTPEGSQEIHLPEGRISFGRGGDVDHRFPDAGLSRLHATIYREGDRIWIVDENSSNGTFVNGIAAAPSGTPLYNGDEIKIGNETLLTIHIAEKPVAQAAATSSAATMNPVATGNSMPDSPMSLLPMLLIAFSILIVSVSAVVVGFKIFGPVQAEVVKNSYDTDDIDISPTPNRTPDKQPDNDPENGSLPQGNLQGDDGELPSDPTKIPGPETGGNLLKGKTYLEVSDQEKRQYIADRSMRIAQFIGNRSSDNIPPEAITAIKRHLDGFAGRIKSKPLSGGCRLRDNLASMYERASKNAPFIIRAFNEKGIDPRIGLYLAMIESEHCVCLQSPTKPLGMFQFTYATAKNHFGPDANLRPDATETSPDDRCNPELAAKAAASYMKALTARFGTGPASVPLAIGSYNSGEGGLSSNLVKALESGQGLERDFWTLISKSEILSQQFKDENFKYVPLFFAAAIVGENPQDFGLKLRPISTYTK